MKKHINPVSRSRKSFVVFITIFAFFQAALAQEKFSIVRANSSKVDIRDGEVYQKGIWNLSPEIKPDIYYSLDPVANKKITFYTDIDSVTFDVEVGREYSFIILLNDKDSCFTKISNIHREKKTDENVLISGLIHPELLQQDFAVFKSMLEKEHPGLYRYLDKASVNRIFDSCFSTLHRPISQLDFAKLITYAISSIKDGHTGTNVSRLLMKYYGESKKLFPVYVYFINDKAFVLCSRIAELSPGCELLSIDSKSVTEIKNKLFQYLPSDGTIESKKMHTLNNGAFFFLFDWIYGSKERFVVQFKDFQGNIKTTVVNADLISDLDCDYENGRGKGKLELSYPIPGAALLAINTFDDSRLAGENFFKKFLDSAFSEINRRSVSNLIIDLRGNAGGTDTYGALLYSYLADKPFKYFLSVETTTKKFTLAENELLGKQHPQPGAFRGDVYFLVNGLSFSTTADFCAIARGNNRGVFVGEETGGAYNGNTSGRVNQLQLRNSKIMVTIPLVKYINDVPETKQSDRGVIPDFKVLPSIHDILMRRDAQLEFIIEKVNEKMKKSVVR
ncbi:S41 family peptidase [Pollutibacter soli]|uniref:S41 family peptidase n=1 Tax=Pollutibacter soli TaxID=3034157 RepID=UPI003013ED57